MKLIGRFTYLDKHRPSNIDKMFKWAGNTELIQIECGSIEHIPRDKALFAETSMQTMIEYNAIARKEFIHFGIYKKVSDELVGYIDFQDISYSEGTAEISISIPELSERNRGYGFEAFALAKKFAFDELENFYNEVENVANQQESKNLNAQVYYNASLQAINDRGSRLKRGDIIRTIILETV